MRRLTNIEIEELSLVSKPANLTPFSIIKSDNKENFESVERLLFGFSKSDLDLLDSEAIETLEPIQKASSGNPFPSLTNQFRQNEKNLNDYFCLEGA